MNSCESVLEGRENHRWFLACRHHRNTHNEPLDFKVNPFLEAIYRDQCPHMVMKKSVQSGGTEFLVCDTLALADRGLRVFYVMPTIELRNVFVQDRVNRTLLSSPYYRRKIRKAKQREDILDVDRVGLKSFGEKGMILFVGSNSPVSFLSFPADVVIVDEIDACHEKNLSLAPGRLAHSPYKWTRKVSTPTHEDFGIDAEYKASDQRAWLLKCEHCGEHQELDFFVNVVFQVGDNQHMLRDQGWESGAERDIGVFCRRCQKPIDRLSRGEWIPRYPGRHLSGYAISRLFSAQATMAELYDHFLEGLKNETKMQRFWNLDLGLAYTATGTKLTPAILNQCVKAGDNYNMPSRSAGCTMGVDVGQPLLHVKICDHPREGCRRVVWVGTVRDFEDLHTKVALYGVRWAVVDMTPETRKAQEFQDQMRGFCQVWLCKYPSVVQDEAMRVKEDEQIIVADRTQVLDAYVSEILNQRILFPANAASLDNGEFYRQLCASTRLYDEIMKHYYWSDHGKPDHYFHAGSYERMACQFMSGLIEVPPAQQRSSFGHASLRRKARNA